MFELFTYPEHGLHVRTPRSHYTFRAHPTSTCHTIPIPKPQPTSSCPSLIPSLVVNSIDPPVRVIELCAMALANIACNPSTPCGS